MLDPVSDIEYHTADDQQLGPAELEELLTTEECAVELYRGTDEVLSIAEPRRFQARDVDAMVRHPSADPADAYLEVEFRATLSLARDRCQSVSVDRPTHPVSTAKRDIIEAVRDTDADDPDDGGVEDGSDTPKTWKCSDVTTQVSSGAEELETPPSDRGSSEGKTVTSGCPQSQSETSDSDDHDEDADSDDEDEDKIRFSLQDGPADDDAE